MKCLIYKGNVTGPHILVSFPRPLSLSLRQQSSLLQHQTTPLKSPPHYSTATGPSKSAKTSWQAPRPLPCSPSLTSVQCLTCGSFLLDTLPSLCFPRHQLLLVLSTSDNFRVGGGWWWWQEHFVLSFNNAFFFFCLSLIIHSYIGVQDSVLVSSHATYYFQGISFTSILPKDDSQVLNSLLGSVSLLPTSHWVSVLEQPTDSSNSTPAKICELPFLSVHSVFPIVTDNDANASFHASKLGSCSLQFLFVLNYIQSLRSCLLCLYIFPLRSPSHCFNSGLHGSHCGFSHWSPFRLHITIRARFYKSITYLLTKPCRDFPLPIR